MWEEEWEEEEEGEEDREEWEEDSSTVFDPTMTPHPVYSQCYHWYTLWSFECPYSSPVVIAVCPPLQTKG